MKNKIIYALALVFILFFNVFAGCNFTTTNTTKNYNTVVATVGEDIEITKYQLLSAYQNYGYQYVNAYGMSYKDAYEKILNGIIDNEILAKYVSDNFKTIFGVDELAEYEISEIWQNVFDYVNDTELLSYVNQLRTDKGLEKIETDKEEDEETERFIREDYQRKIDVIYGNNGEIIKVTQKKTEHDTNLRVSEGDFKFTYYGNKSNSNDKLNELAIKQFKNYIKESADDKTLSDEQLFSDHLNNLFKNHKKSYLISKFEEFYKDNKEITIDSILSKYKELLKADAQKYTGEREDYVSAVQSDASSVYFHPYSDELIYVSHILIKYDRNNTDYNLKKDYLTKYENGEISEAQYLSLINDANLGVNCKVYQMVDGVFEDEPTDMNAIDLYNIVSQDIDSTEGTDNKLDKFLDYAYTYNQDTGMFSSADLYTVQLDNTLSDTMVTEFADLSRELYNTKGVGSVGICYTQYGAHIIYVAGVVGNKIVNNVSASSLAGITVEQLENTLARLGYNKTLLDVIAEKVTNDNYSTYQEQVVLQVKNEYKAQGVDVIIFDNKLQDLY